MFHCADTILCVIIIVWAVYGETAIKFWWQYIYSAKIYTFQLFDSVPSAEIFYFLFFLFW